MRRRKGSRGETRGPETLEGDPLGKGRAGGPVGSERGSSSIKVPLGRRRVGLGPSDVCRRPAGFVWGQRKSHPRSDKPQTPSHGTSGWGGTVGEEQGTGVGGTRRKGYTFVYTYIYTHTYTYVLTHTCTRVWTHAHVRTRTCVHTYIHIRTHTYVHTYTHIRTHTFAYTRTTTHIYTRTHVHTYNTHIRTRRLPEGSDKRH